MSADLSRVLVPGAEEMGWFEIFAEEVEHALKQPPDKHLARYKLPKAIVYRDAIQRSPSGKADYRRAKEQAGEGG